MIDTTDPFAQPAKKIGEPNSKVGYSQIACWIPADNHRLLRENGINISELVRSAVADRVSRITKLT